MARALLLTLARSAFSFADQELKTPWITVWDGHGHSAQRIVVRFGMVDGEITRVQVDVQGGCPACPGRPPGRSRGCARADGVLEPTTATKHGVLLEYVWEEEAVANTQTMLRVMFLCGFILSVLVPIAVTLDFFGNDSQRRRLGLKSWL